MAELQCFPEGPYISTVKLGPKGQIVIPKEIRSRSGVRPGDNLVLVANRRQLFGPSGRPVPGPGRSAPGSVAYRFGHPDT